MLYVVAFYPIYVLNLKKTHGYYRCVLFDFFLISTNGSMKIKKSRTLELYSAFGGGLKY